MHNPCRDGENQPYLFRSGRFYSVNGKWYFASREAPVHGPFLERSTAEEACTRLMRGLRRLASGT